jgi:DNA-binding NarL/FixJ family response regulator
METKIKVMVVDDDQLVGAAMVRLLATLPGIEVVGLAVDPGQAVVLERVLRPDVAVVDLDMTGIRGVETTRWMKGLPDPPAVIGFSGFDSDVARKAAEAAGADALLRDFDDAAALEVLVRAVALRRRPPGTMLVADRRLGKC